MGRLRCVSLSWRCRRAVSVCLSRRERDGNKLWKVRRKGGGCRAEPPPVRRRREKRERGGESCIFAAFAPLMALVCFSQFVRYRWSPGIHRFARIFLPGFCPIPRSARGWLHAQARDRAPRLAARMHERTVATGPEKPSFYTAGPPLNANEREAKQRSRSPLWRRVYRNYRSGCNVKAGSKLLRFPRKSKTILSN